MPNENQINGNDNISIQEVTGSHIVINKNKIKNYFILFDFSDFRKQMDAIGAKDFVLNGQLHQLSSINEAGFNEILSKSKNIDNEIPSAKFNDNFDQDAFEDYLKWCFENQEVAIKSNAKYGDLIECFGWLLEPYLRKLAAKPAANFTKERLVLLVETYRASLRYLCYIQMSNVLILPDRPKIAEIAEFMEIQEDDDLNFNYYNQLVQITQALQKDKIPDFVDEIPLLVNMIQKPGNLLIAVNTLEKTRILLLKKGEFSSDLLAVLLNDCLCALAEWMKNIAFLAKYRLVSIKNINLNYRLGTNSYFVHLFGELHGIYSESTASLENRFTYSHSILLLKGNLRDTFLQNKAQADSYLSLSPFVIDLSVYKTVLMDTPELYYFRGQRTSNAGKEYVFVENAQIELLQRKEAAVGNVEELEVEKDLIVKPQNGEAKINDLYVQLNKLFTEYLKP